MFSHRQPSSFRDGDDTAKVTAGASETQDDTATHSVATDDTAQGVDAQLTVVLQAQEMGVNLDAFSLPPPVHPPLDPLELDLSDYEETNVSFFLSSL